MQCPVWPLACWSKCRQAVPAVTIFAASGTSLAAPKKSSVRRGTGQSNSSLGPKPDVPDGWPSWNLFKTFALHLVGEEPVCSRPELQVLTDTRTRTRGKQAPALLPVIPVAQTPPWPALYAEEGCLCVLASPTQRREPIQRRPEPARPGAVPSWQPAPRVAPNPSRCAQSPRGGDAVPPEGKG